MIFALEHIPTKTVVGLTTTYSRCYVAMRERMRILRHGIEDYRIRRIEDIEEII